MWCPPAPPSSPQEDTLSDRERQGRTHVEGTLRPKLRVYRRAPEQKMYNGEEAGPERPETLRPPQKRPPRRPNPSVTASARRRRPFDRSSTLQLERRRPMTRHLKVHPGAVQGHLQHEDVFPRRHLQASRLHQLPVQPVASEEQLPLQLGLGPVVQQHQEAALCALPLQTGGRRSWGAQDDLTWFESQVCPFNTHHITSAIFSQTDCGVP